jgi:hypothetical protein
MTLPFLCKHSEEDTRSWVDASKASLRLAEIGLKIAHAQKRPNYRLFHLFAADLPARSLPLSFVISSRPYGFPPYLRHERILRDCDGSCHSRRRSPVLQKPIMGTADGEYRHRLGVRSFLPEIPQALMN